MASDAFLDHVLDQLGELSGLTTKAMFGGHGVYFAGTFFAIVYGDRLYFRTDDNTRPRFEAAGMGPFRPNERQTIRSYFEVPPDVIEDRDELVEWALLAIDTHDG